MTIPGPTNACADEPADARTVAVRPNVPCPDLLGLWRAAIAGTWRQGSRSAGTDGDEARLRSTPTIPRGVLSGATVFVMADWSYLAG